MRTEARLAFFTFLPALVWMGVIPSRSGAG